MVQRNFTAAQMIDHAWAVALNRAQKAGILLAHILMSGAHGDRPVTLVGYSMGARLIFHCLLELCRYSAKGDALFPFPVFFHIYATGFMATPACHLTVVWTSLLECPPPCPKKLLRYMCESKHRATIYDRQ